MLIFTCIIILKYWGGKYRGLSAFLVVMILFSLFFLTRKIYKHISNEKITEEWINTLDFSNTLEISKQGKIQPYPEITILSDIDGKVMSLNVSTGDIVDEYQNIIQIENENLISSDYYDIDEMIEVMYENYNELEKQYEEFQNQYLNKIDDLEKQLFNRKNALIQAMELKDNESKEILEEEIEKISKDYELIKNQKEDMRYRLNSLDSEAKMIINESDKYYNELEKQFPKSPFKGIVGNIYVSEGDVINNGDKLITIINNNLTPEIIVSLDFNEYLLTKDLTGVDIIIENENRGDLYYKGEIYTRSPILNEEGKYNMTIKFIDDDISHFILGDDNSQINVNFIIDSASVWIPNRCFKIIGKNNGILTLRDGDVVVDKEVLIKNRWNNWINVDNLTLFGLEKEEEKDGIDLCIEDWNNERYKDEIVVEWRNQFNTIEDFCGEFIKVNPMYWTGHRNAAVVSLLGGSGENIEVLCDIE